MEEVVVGVLISRRTSIMKKAPKEKIHVSTICFHLTVVTVASLMQECIGLMADMTWLICLMLPQLVICLILLVMCVCVY